MTSQKQLWAFDRKSEKKENWTEQFQTPAPVAKFMVSLIPPGSRAILEPTPGKGNVVAELTKGSYDITAPMDFFLLDPKLRFDCVVMNPPFSSRYALLENAPTNMLKSGMRLGYEILRVCMKKSNSIIALMPWFTLSDSDLRLSYLMGFGMRSLTALPRKTFQYARIQTVIIELQKGYQGITVFRSYRWDKEETNGQKSLFSNDELTGII